MKIVKSKYYVHPVNLPPKIPLVPTLFWWMFLDYTNAPGWAFGAIGSGVALLWVLFFVDIFSRQSKDLFDGQ